MSDLDELSDVEENVLLFLWIEASTVNLFKHLEYDFSTEEITGALQNLTKKGFLTRTRHGSYVIPLKIRRKYSYQPASLANGGYPRLVPEKTQPVQRKRRKRSL